MELSPRTILGGAVTISIPKTFTSMPLEVLKTRYPMENRPSIVFSDASYLVNIAFKQTTTGCTQEQIFEAKDYIKRGIEKSGLTVFLSDGVESINGRKVGYFEFFSQGNNIPESYNLIFFTDIKGLIVMGTFNCPKRVYKDWELVALNILLSLKINY